MLKEKKVFISGGIDQDTDQRHVKPNMFRYALNCLVNNSINGNTGCIENRKGNTLVSFTLPDGVNRVCGAVKDIQRSSIVYFVQNSQKNHCILRYNINTQTVDKILYAEPALNFQEGIIISSINIIGDLLYYTDGYFNKFTYDPALGEFKDQYFNPPRKLNMVKAYNYTNNVAVNPLYKYSAIDEQVLDRIKYEPSKRIDAVYVNDVVKMVNNLRGKLFQFTYRYVYDDNEKSVVATYSNIPLPQDETTALGEFADNVNINNAINLIFNTGAEIVKKIELLVREGNNKDWYSFYTIDKYDNNGNRVILDNILFDYSVSNGYGFYNDNALFVVDQLDIARPFDYVPQISDSSTVLSDNRIIDGSITENYDNVDLDIDLIASFEDVRYSNTIVDIPVSLIFSQQSGYMFKIEFPPVGIANALYTITVDYGYTPPQINQFSHSMTDAGLALYPTKLRDQFYNDLVATFTGVSNISTSSNNIIFLGFPFGAVAADSSCKLFYNNGIGSRSTFKTGRTHSFGIVYLDRAGRSGATNNSGDIHIFNYLIDKTVKTAELYIPFLTEFPFGNIDFHRAWNIIWQINHQPPEWATHYKWVYKRNTSYFLQFYYTAAESTLDSNDIIRIRLNFRIDELRTKIPNLNIKDYSFVKGDRIRFIYKGNIASNVATVMPYLDYEIMGYDTTTGGILIQNFGFAGYDIGLTGGYDFMVFEIYRPNALIDNMVYYDFSDVIEIGDPHTSSRYHKKGKSNGVVGVDQDISLGVPASGIFDYGDIYLKFRYAQIPPNIMVEDANYSDYYDSDAISIGKPSAVISDMKRQKYTNLRYSGQYLEDTKINNLSRFDFLNQKNVSNEFGGITSLSQLGDTLKVLQQNKNTSFYIGVQMMTSADGNQIPIQSSGVVLSKPNMSPLGYGCQHPESVMVNDRYMYFYDQNYGVFIRDAANGMTIVSDNGMKSFFTRKRQEINDSYKHKVITSFNKKFNEVVVTFITTNLVVDPIDLSVMREVVLSETVCFCENSNTWTTFLSYSKYIGLTDTPIDYMANNGETFVTFLNGQLYLENDGVFGNFFGEQKSMVVDVISNIENEKVKIFSAIGLTTNHNKTSLPDSWYVDSIIVPTTDVNAAGQLSEIAASGFRMKEEALYADVPRDINSPMQGSNKFKLINGRVMRGQCATFRLKNNSNDAVVLYSVIIKTIPSEMSK